MTFIGITGGSGSGKTAIAEGLRHTLGVHQTSVIHQDNYYNDHSHIPLTERRKINFDHPDSFDFKLLQQHLEDLRNQKGVEQPVYSYRIKSRTDKTLAIFPEPWIIVEGLYLFIKTEIAALFDIKIFLDANTQTRFDRIAKRDARERGWNMEQTHQRFNEVVDPMYNTFVKSQQASCDYVVANHTTLHECLDKILTLIKS